MDRVRAIRAKGDWPELWEAGTITLSAHDRYRRRIVLKSDGGREFLLDLAEAVQLGDGDGLLLEEDEIIRVVAAAEPVLEVTAGRASLARLAYHLGNRHLPIQILPDCLLTMDDGVIASMVEALGGAVRRVKRPFDPESGAYDRRAHAHSRPDL